MSNKGVALKANVRAVRYIKAKKPPGFPGGFSVTERLSESAELVRS